MKALSFLLACYVFCLSVGPVVVEAFIYGAEEGCETVCGLTADDNCAPLATESEHNHSPDGCCGDGVCNPFAGCPGCAGFTIPAISGLANMTDMPTVQPVASVNVNPRLADHMVWHPPQII